MAGVDERVAEPDVAQLSARITDLERALDAIRSGGVDAVIAGEPGAEQVYTLASAERPYRVIVEEMNEGALTVSPGGVVLYANPCFGDMVGRRPLELVGTPVETLVVPEDRPLLGLLFGLRPGGHARVEARLDRPVAAALPVVLAGSCLDIEGTFVHCLVATDLSERKHAEAVLEERVAARTADLEAANARLVEANEELDSFSSSVSHDLRAPLRAIHGYSQILLQEHADRLDPDGRRLLGNVSRNAERMSQLIDDLLAFSRTSRASMARRRVDMGALARAAVKDLVEAVPGRAVHVEVGDLVGVDGDASLLRSVWENLVSNALKFTAEGREVRVTITSEVVDGDAVYHVRDNGIGFEMAYADKMFGVFERLHGARYEGTGIGLPIVKRIVERHGGRVWAEGEVGRGACFSFSLPLLAVRANDDGRGHAAARQ